MGAFLQVFDERTAVIKACGRICADMNPQTLPVIPIPPPLSFLAMRRAHPDMVIDPEWLAGMETGATVH